MVLLTIQFLLLLKILTKRRIELGQSEDSHFYSSPRALSHEGTHKEGFYRPHLVSDHHGGDAFRPRLDSSFLRGVDFLASLLGVVGCRHVLFSET